jgi:hypothetical protein
VSDPSLMVAMAKVGALEHGVRQLGRALGTVSLLWGLRGRGMVRTNRSCSGVERLGKGC